MKVSHYLSGAVRQFSYWFVHGTLGYPVLEGIDYLSELAENSSCMEQAFSIFMNNLELDDAGNVLNYEYCERRAAEYIRSYFEPAYCPDLLFEDWELELYPVSKEAYNQ
ncbi:MAG: hypothetical protein NC489_44820 [Ruminococcus flavefaciens]|nr:hypothetical protein [Ruminococcus flavefaciens]